MCSRSRSGQRPRRVREPATRSAAVMWARAVFGEGERHICSGEIERVQEWRGALLWAGGWRRGGVCRPAQVSTTTLGWKARVERRRTARAHNEVAGLEMHPFRAERRCSRGARACAPRGTVHGSRTPSHARAYDALTDDREQCLFTKISVFAGYRLGLRPPLSSLFACARPWAGRRSPSGPAGSRAARGVAVARRRRVGVSSDVRGLGVGPTRTHGSTDDGGDWEDGVEGGTARGRCASVRTQVQWPWGRGELRGVPFRSSGERARAYRRRYRAEDGARPSVDSAFQRPPRPTLPPRPRL